MSLSQIVQESVGSTGEAIVSILIPAIREGSVIGDSISNANAQIKVERLLGLLVQKT